MAIPWLAVLKAVPWAQVISTAPLVADGAKKLWDSVSGTKPDQAATAHRDASSSTERESVATMQERLAAMEIATDELHQQMLASSELIKTLADQNAQLIRRMEEGRVRMQRLTLATIVIGIMAALGLFAAFAR